MKNKKNPTKDAGDITAYYYDDSSDEERKQLLKLIEEACKKGDRAKCYEHLMEYSYKEPYQIDSSKFEKSNYQLFIPNMGSAEFLISTKYSLEEIVMYMNIQTDLYGIGYHLMEGTFIVHSVECKKDALLIAEKTFEIMKKITKIFNYDISDEQIANEICIYGNGKNRPKWMDENGDDASLKQWRMHPEELE